MKKSIIILSLVLISMISKAQMPFFSDSNTYISTYNKTVYGQKETHQPEVTFTFEGDVMTTTMKDQKSRFRSYGEIETGNDPDHTWKTYQCLDNSGSRVNLTFAFDKASKTQVIIIFYKGQTYDYFEVESCTAPIKPVFITDNIESLGVFGENNSEDISIEEFKTRVNESGKLIGIDNLGNRLEPIIKAAVFNEIANGVTSADNKPKRWQKGSSVDDPHIIIEKK